MEESRLTSRTRFLLGLVRVGVSGVSWAFRYLDKLQWRAVAARILEKKIVENVVPTKNYNIQIKNM